MRSDRADRLPPRPALAVDELDELIRPGAEVVQRVRSRAVEALYALLEPTDAALGPRDVRLDLVQVVRDPVLLVSGV